MNRLLQIVFFFLAILTSLPILAQERTVTGRITSSEDDSPLAGVNILVQGTQRGTTTDANGAYRIQTPEGGKLIFSYVGFTRQEIAVGNRSIVNVALQVDAANLSEVVVTGYGQQIKRDLTGNIATVKAQDLQNIPVPSLETALQGKAAGVVVNQGTGKLGQGVQIRVRGSSSITASNGPLFVVDGIPVTSESQSNIGGSTSPQADINFNDVESVEILKDASAGAIYGARAANGVILITTKHGGVGKTNVSVSVQGGVSVPTHKIQLMTGQQYVDFYRQAAAAADRVNGNDPKALTSYSAEIEEHFETYSAKTFNKGVTDAINQGKDYTTVRQTSATAPNVNWQNQAFEQAPSYQADLNINGGNERTRFYVSGQYFNQKGILILNAFERYSGRLNLDHKANDWLSLGINLSLARTQNNRVAGDFSFTTPLQAIAMSPLTPLIDPVTGLPIGTPPGDINLPLYYNPLLNKQNVSQGATVFRNLSQVYGQVSIVKGLQFRTEFGLDILNQEEDVFYNSKVIRITAQPRGIGFNTYSNVVNYNTNNYFSYDRAFGLHTINATLGMSYQQSQTKGGSVQAIQFPSDSYRQISSAANITGGDGYTTNFRFLSYFLRANYKFNNKYLVSVSGRIDGSSRFPAGKRYGYFPAASAGWVLSEEDFLSDNKKISFLKLRASYGLTGNAEIGNFPALGLYQASNYAGTGGQAQTQLANAGLKWENTTQTDVGIDFGLFNNRLTGEVDYYVKNTNDLLLSVNIPATTGFGSLVRNVGKLSNKGFEIVLTSQNSIGKFKWTTNFNLASNRNKVLDVAGQIIEGGVGPMSRVVEGQPLGTFYTVEYAGVDPANGDALFYKNTKNADGTIDHSTTKNYDEAERVVMGNAVPKFTGGLTNTFGYKGFDLSIFLNGVYGNKLNFYGVGQYASANGIYEDNQTVDQLKAWTPENTNTNVPEARWQIANGNQASSRFLMDGSYLRLRTVSLGYTLPKALISKAKLSSVRVYVLVQNLLTLTKYKGWDPEVNSDGATSNVAQGYDFYSAPQAKTFTAGLNLTF